MKKVIVISGIARSGKDTTGLMIKENIEKEGGRVVLCHYADLLKYICKQFFGWNGEKDEKGRSMLQHVGTDVIRKQNPNFWVSFICVMLRFFGDEWDYMVIPDCRFPNEIDYLKAYGYDVVHIRVERDGYANGLTDEQKKHPSETALNNIKPDYTILNSGNLDDLQATVIKWIKENL